MLRITSIYFCLFLFAVPWYWPEDDQRLLFGFPLWVSVSVIMSVIISAYTAYLLLTHSWQGEE